MRSRGANRTARSFDGDYQDTSDRRTRDAGLLAGDHRQPAAINLLDADIPCGFQELIDELESDQELQVVVFDSADPDFFIAHISIPSSFLVRSGESDHSLGPTGMAPCPDFTLRLTQVPVISVASVRGRARGIGNGVVLVTDVRFTSREKAIFGQFEIGSAVMSGGGG